MYAIEWHEDAFGAVADAVARLPYRRREFGVALRVITGLLGEFPSDVGESRANCGC